jgi:hypothetical protein
MPPPRLDYPAADTPSGGRSTTFSVAGLVAGCVAAFAAVLLAIGRWSDHQHYLWLVCPATTACFHFLLPSAAFPWTLGLVIGPVIEWTAAGVVLDSLRSRRSPPRQPDQSR